jgi:phage terminase large subunit-like protein
LTTLKRKNAAQGFWTQLLQKKKYFDGSIASKHLKELKQLSKHLSENALCALPYDFDIWALPHQRAPEGDWSTWVILGGRGAGKTRAGAEWVRGLVEGPQPHLPGICRRVALIGDTVDQVREVMIFGDSGILACSPADRRPKWNSTRKSLVWENGAEALVVSAQNPEALRGPQFEAAWLDELAKWKKARTVWDMLQFTLRLGETPRSMVTTTPRSQTLLAEILDRDDTVVTSAPTTANKANLPDVFVRKIIADYGGTRTGREEIYGEMIGDVEGALWSLSQFDAMRSEAPEGLDRIIVAVDPPATSGENADACGVIVAGAIADGEPQDWRAYVLADLTIEKATPNQWAAVVCQAVKDFGADRVVAEVNQGGEMVEAVLRQQSALVPYRAVRATRGKIVRAEPVSSLYEQGRVYHVGDLTTLEDQMVQMTFQGFQGSGSPDRVDALVWALTDLMVDPSNTYQRPQLRGL